MKVIASKNPGGQSISEFLALYFPDLTSEAPPKEHLPTYRLAVSLPYVTIIARGFAVPSAVREKLSTCYEMYISLHREDDHPLRHKHPLHVDRYMQWCEDDSIALVVLEEHAPGWIALLNDLAIPQPPHLLLPPTTTQH